MIYVYRMTMCICSYDVKLLGCDSYTLSPFLGKYLVYIKATVCGLWYITIYIIKQILRFSYVPGILLSTLCDLTVSPNYSVK